MDKIKIGIDIDGVLCDSISHFVQEAKKRFGVTVNKEDIVKFDIAAQSDLLQKQVTEIFSDPDYLSTLSPLPHAVNIIRSLSAVYELHIVTTRYAEIKFATVDWLNEHKFAYYYIVTTNDKAGYAQQCGIEYFIEDRYKNAMSLANVCKKVLLFDAPWNRRPISDNIVRVHNWLEVPEGLIDAEVWAKFSLHRST